MNRFASLAVALVASLTLVGDCDRESAQTEGVDKRVYSWVDRAYSTQDVHIGLLQCQEATRFARSGGGPRAQLHAMTCVGRMEARVPRYDVALKLFEEILRYAESVGDEAYEAVALANESQVLIKLGLFDWADERILRGLNRLGPESSRPDTQNSVRSTLLINQSVVAREQKCYNRSLEILERAALLPTDHEQQLLIASNRGHTLFAARRYEEALAELDRIRGWVHRQGDLERIAELEGTRGNSMSALGNTRDAISTIDRALSYSRVGGTTYLTAEILIDLAQAQIAADFQTEAQASFEQALEIADSIGVLGLKERALEGLSKLQVWSGGPEPLKRLEQLSAIRQRRAEEDSRHRLQSLQALFEAEAKVREAEALHDKERGRRRLTHALAVVSILLMVVLAQVLSRYRSETRLNRKIRSDHKQLQRLNNDLVQANWRELGQLNRISALGAMAAAFAHELRQPLTAIITNAQAAQRALPTDFGASSLVGGAVGDTVEAARRAQEIVRRLRLLMQKGTIDKKRLDLNTLIHEVEDLVRREAKARDVALELELTSDRLPVSGDQIELQQVILNLVQNGINASQSNPAGERQLFLRTVRLDSATGAIEVEDRGPMIGERVLTRMFEPLFTTKDCGLGMGLALCRAIAEAHDGKTSAVRNAEGGLTVRLTLPLLDSAVPKFAGSEKEVA